MKQTFTQRFSFGQSSGEITRREEAPAELRSFIVQLLYDFGWSPSDVRKLFCRVLRIRPDDNNWSEYPNIDYEVGNLIDAAPWHKVYDIIERAYDALKRDEKDSLTEELNSFLLETGLGWKFLNGQFEFRGSDSFELMLKETSMQLAQKGLQTSKGEIEQALRDMTPRHLDITGAIQHSMAALECLSREKTGSKDTLGKLLQRNPTLLPSPLSGALEQIFGYASNNGRHLLEGKNPQLAEAELVVNLAVSLCRYLAQSIPDQNVPETNEDDLPF